MYNKPTFLYTFCLLTVIVLTLTSLAGCNCIKGSKQVVSDTLVFSGLNKADINGDFKVFIRQDTTIAGRLIIIGEDNIVPRVIATRLADSTLVIGFDNEGCFGSYQRIELYLTMPIVKGLKTVGSENIIAQTDLKNNSRIDFDIWGSGNVTLKAVNAPIVDIDLNSSGNIFFENLTANAITSKISSIGNIEVQQGTAYSHNLSLLGEGDFHGFYLYVTNYDIIVNAVGSGEINCSGELEVFMNGTGNIYHRGNPQSIVISGNGTGIVTGG